MKKQKFQGIITNDAKLLALCVLFEQSKNIALDTEYVRESTYYPQPSLVQISDGNNHALVDIMALQDLQPLKKLLASPKITKIIHSSEQDLMILERIYCPLKYSLFDTQLAAAFLGYGYMIGYQALVQVCLDVKLKKGYARSNWLARPLSEAQINYAIEDVLYLHELHKFLAKQLQKSGKESWFEEESKHRLDNYQANYSDYFVPKILGQGRLISTYEKKRLTQLARWREDKAKQVNLPRRWLIKDKYLIAIARNQMSLHKLIEVYNNDIENADVVEIDERLKSVEYKIYREQPPLSQDDRRLIVRIKKLVSQLAKEYKIEQSLIASHKQILRYVRDKQNRTNTVLVSGWRHHIIKQPIEQLIATSNG